MIFIQCHDLSNYLLRVGKLKISYKDKRSLKGQYKDYLIFSTPEALYLEDFEQLPISHEMYAQYDQVNKNEKFSRNCNTKYIILNKGFSHIKFANKEHFYLPDILCPLVTVNIAFNNSKKQTKHLKNYLIALSPASKIKLVIRTVYTLNQWVADILDYILDMPNLTEVTVDSSQFIVSGFKPCDEDNNLGMQILS